jgi:hypothetical protein
MSNKQSATISPRAVQARAPTSTQLKRPPSTLSAPPQEAQGGPSKAARLQGISLSKAGAAPGPPAAEEAASKESNIRKKVEGLQTLELLDNLVNFLNDA